MQPIPTDAGLQAITQQLSSGRVTDEQNPKGGGELDIMAQLAVSLGTLNSELRRGRRPQIPFEYCHPITLAPEQSSAAGSLSDPDRWGPKANWAWHITGLTVILGAGATQWTIYQDAAIPTNTKVSNTVSGLWEPKGWFLLPQNQIVYGSTGGGIIVSVGSAIEIALDWLATYLM